MNGTTLVILIVVVLLFAFWFSAWIFGKGGMRA